MTTTQPTQPPSQTFERINSINPALWGLMGLRREVRDPKYWSLQEHLLYTKGTPEQRDSVLYKYN